MSRLEKPKKEDKEHLFTVSRSRLEGIIYDCYFEATTIVAVKLCSHLYWPNYFRSCRKLYLELLPIKVLEHLVKLSHSGHLFQLSGNLKALILMWWWFKYWASIK